MEEGLVGQGPHLLVCEDCLVFVMCGKSLPLPLSHTHTGIRSGTRKGVTILFILLWIIQLLLYVKKHIAETLESYLLVEWMNECKMESKSQIQSKLSRYRF